MIETTPASQTVEPAASIEGDLGGTPSFAKLLEPALPGMEPEFLGEWDLEAVGTLWPEPPGPPPLLSPSAMAASVQDVDWAHRLLAAGGVPADDRLAHRIAWVADRWLGLAHANEHTDGCQCKQCKSSNRILGEYRAILAE